MRPRRALTWDQVGVLCKRLADQISEDLLAHNLRGILAVARGGLAPAAILAHRLGLRDVTAITVQSYSGAHMQERGRVRISGKDLDHVVKWARMLGAHGTEPSGGHILIVDDLIDSGATLQVLTGMLRASLVRCHVAVLLGDGGFPPGPRPTLGPNIPVYCASPKPPGVWIDFPWES